jgi:hypothetical protein
MNDIQAPAPDNAVGVAQSDIAYFSWELDAIATGGIASNRSRYWVQDGIEVSDVLIGNSGLLGLSQDTVAMPEIQSILDSVEFGRNVNETVRRFMYFSLPVKNASSLSWDPYVGIDEYDEPYFKSGAMIRELSCFLIYVCIIFFQV